MQTFLNATHVLAAVLLIGPLVAAPFAGRRAIGRRSADGVRNAANQMTFFGVGSLVVAGLGVVALLASDDYDLGTPWVVISITLYAIALGLVYGYAVPALRRAARMVADGVPGGGSAGGAAGGAAGDPGDGTAGGPGDDAADGPGNPGGRPDDGPGDRPYGEEHTTLVGAAPEALRHKERLDVIAGRIGGAGVLVLLVIAAITLLMSTRPFGS
ncbi:MAG TPA: DUF2269 family protein [Micromonosporaceae bacterium]|nr:DUF2269 family protein [Micromonosporaceae bacterium]